MTRADFLRKFATQTRLIGPIRKARRAYWLTLGTVRYIRKPENLIRYIRRTPADIRAWVMLIDRERSSGRLSSQSAALARSHQIEPGAYVINSLADQIAEKAEAKLTELARQPIGELDAAINEIIRWKTIVQCRNAHRDGGYFSAAEAVIQVQ